MFVPGDVVFHIHHGMCKVREIGDCKFGNVAKPSCYLQLQPLNDQYGTIIFSPLSDTESGKIRRPLSIAEANDLIDSLPTVKAIEIQSTGNKMLDREKTNEVYGAIRDSGDPKKFIRLMRTIYMKKQTGDKARKHLSEYESGVWRQVENTFFQEIAFSLQIPQTKVSDYIHRRLNSAE